MARAGTRIYGRHHKAVEFIPAKAAEVFAYIDDHVSFSSHMNQSSWMMGGGHMGTLMDAKEGRKVGSHIVMKGKVFGIAISLDEVVILREPPLVKAWETVGTPKLLVIGNYRMAVEIEPSANGSLLQVSIDYNLPEKNALIGKLFGGYYAKWCVRQMISGVCDKFSTTKT